VAGVNSKNRKGKRMAEAEAGISDGQAVEVRMLYFYFLFFSCLRLVSAYRSLFKHNSRIR
jgi:hypothetical protein